jgi:hypothetical protein
MILGGLIAAPSILGPALYASGAVAASGRLLFHVLRKGTKIGEHRVSFSAAGDDTLVDIDVAVTVMLGPITLLKYTHHDSERWRAGRFESLESHTVANGAQQKLSARRSGESILADGSKRGRLTLSGAAAPMSHWNGDAMRAPLFNPQDGRMMKVGCAHSNGRFALPDTKVVAASKVVITGESEITDWYDASGAWLALRGKVADGSLVDYVRV